MAYRGKYSIRYPHKYRGDPKKCIFRSSWEFRAMKWFDMNSKIKWWSSEPFPVRYISPIDGKPHNYWIDFVVCLYDKEGKERRIMIEVKPENQTRPPQQQKRKTKQYIKKVQTWGVNQAKWKSAKSLCERKGWEFQIWTERMLDPR